MTEVSFWHSHQILHPDVLYPHFDQKWQYLSFLRSCQKLKAPFILELYIFVLLVKSGFKCVLRSLLCLCLFGKPDTRLNLDEKAIFRFSPRPLLTALEGNSWLKFPVTFYWKLFLASQKLDFSRFSISKIQDIFSHVRTMIDFFETYITFGNIHFTPKGLDRTTFYW